MSRYASVAGVLVSALLMAESALGKPPELPVGVSLVSLQVLEDKSGAQSIDQVRQSLSRFQPSPAGIANYGFTASAYWFRLVLRNRNRRPQELFFRIRHPSLDHASLFVLNSSGPPTRVNSGDRMPAENRAYPATSIVLPFRLEPGDSEVYLRVQADAAAMSIPWQILDEAGMRSAALAENIFHGATLGLFIALLAYNLLLYLMLRDTERFYYLVYLVSAYLSITSLNGFGALLLYPNSTWFGNEGVPFFGGCTFALILQFTRLFLSTADHPWLDRMIKGTIGAALLLAASPFLLPVRLTYELNLVMVFGFPVIGLVAGAATWIMGKREARFYILGQAASWIGLLVFGLLVRGVLPYRNILFEAISLGISADALLLALALADRVGMLRAAKLAAEEAMRQELETRQEQLEELVGQRTTELEIARKHAELLATTDVLTGVYNRRGVLACAERDLQIALRAEHPLSIATFDLDRFKRVNDTYGHAEGDRVLRDVAQVVLRTIRASDLMGRVGGEEFLVVMPDTALEDAAVAAERIRIALAANVFVGSPPVSITASFGIASLSDRCRTLDVLQSLADQALYCAKHNGRNRVELHGAGFTYLEA